MNKSHASERIRLLTESKEAFMRFVDFFNENENFTGPSTYFHRKVINLIRASDLIRLLEDEHFIEYVYATLSSWGMHRMGTGGSKMRDFRDFMDSIASSRRLFLELEKSKLNTLVDEDRKRVFDLLSNLFTNLKVMESESNLVGNSKVIHHLLPDLVPPIDRQYTLRFFYGNLTSKYTPVFDKEEETDIFIEIMDYYHIICKKLKLTNNDYDKTKPMNTSIPKVIDNAIIGFIETRT
jgi:hypothetical protein